MENIALVSVDEKNVSFFECKFLSLHFHSINNFSFTNFTIKHSGNCRRVLKTFSGLDFELNLCFFNQVSIVPNAVRLYSEAVVH